MPNNIATVLSRQDTWRGHSQRLPRRAITTGHNNLDLLLQGGWPISALTELMPQQPGIGELSLLLPTLKYYADNNQLCVWLDPPYQPYSPRLAAADIALDKLLVVRSKNHAEWLWAAEQSIRSGALLLAWTKQPPPRYADLRKLQLAAADSGNAAFLFSAPSALSAPSPAAMRLELKGMEVNQLLLTVRKQRGVAGGACLQLSLGEANTQRTDLALLPADRHRTYPIQQLNN
jgi:protein ImuA